MLTTYQLHKDEFFNHKELMKIVDVLQSDACLEIQNIFKKIP